MQTVSLALMWHQHQPYYPDDVAGENPMPWVRLHATKDYLGMALHLEEVPEFRCTINLVPSLLAQLEAYAAGATDTHLNCSSRPADGLDSSRSLLLARQLLHGQSGYDDPAARPLSRALPASLGLEQLGRATHFRVSAPAICATFRSGPTWPGFTPCSSSRRAIWPNSRPRAATTPKTRSSGSWPGSASWWPASFHCTGSSPRKVRSS